VCIVEIWQVAGNKKERQKVNTQTTKIINGLLAKAVIVLLTASAFILTPPILAGLELLARG
jgi:hypothetical protein